MPVFSASPTAHPRPHRPMPARTVSHAGHSGRMHLAALGAAFEYLDNRRETDRKFLTALHSTDISS